MTFLCSEGKNIGLTSCKEKRGTFIFLFECYETLYFNVFSYKLSFSIIQEGLFVCEVTFFVKPKLSLYGKLDCFVFLLGKEMLFKGKWCTFLCNYSVESTLLSQSVELSGEIWYPSQCPISEERVQNKMHIEMGGYLHVCSIQLPIVENSLIYKKIRTLVHTNKSNNKCP